MFLPFLSELQQWEMRSLTASGKQSCPLIMTELALKTSFVLSKNKFSSMSARAYFHACLVRTEFQFSLSYNETHRYEERRWILKDRKPKSVTENSNKVAQVVPNGKEHKSVERGSVPTQTRKNSSPEVHKVSVYDEITGN